MHICIKNVLSVKKPELDPPGGTSVSVKSDRSMITPIIFKNGDNLPNEGQG